MEETEEEGRGETRGGAQGRRRPDRSVIVGKCGLQGDAADEGVQRASSKMNVVPRAATPSSPVPPGYPTTSLREGASLPLRGVKDGAQTGSMACLSDTGPWARVGGAQLSRAAPSLRSAPSPQNRTPEPSRCL